MVTVPETWQSREKGVELGVWGADDNRRWGHETKHHLREALHISKSEVLYAENQTDRERPGKHGENVEKQENETIIYW